jgi:hypothetical protein
MESIHTHGGRSGGARLALVAVVAAFALLGIGAAGASAAQRRIDRATTTCWKAVVNDWLQHQPNVLGSYPIPCYTQAIQHLDQYVDIQQYSNAPDDIHRALVAALRNNRGDGGPGSGGSAVGPVGGPGGPTNGGPGDGSGHKGVVTRLFDRVGPGDAQSIPLPLLVLAGLAVLLLLAAAGTWLAKRLQARRMTPATAPFRGTAPRGE